MRAALPPTWTAYRAERHRAGLGRARRAWAARTAPYDRETGQGGRKR